MDKFIADAVSKILLFCNYQSTSTHHVEIKFSYHHTRDQLQLINQELIKHGLKLIATYDKHQLDCDCNPNCIPIQVVISQIS